MVSDWTSSEKLGLVHPKSTSEPASNLQLSSPFNSMGKLRNTGGFLTVRQETFTIRICLTESAEQDLTLQTHTPAAQCLCIAPGCRR